MQNGDRTRGRRVPGSQRKDTRLKKDPYTIAYKIADQRGEIDIGSMLDKAELEAHQVSSVLTNLRKWRAHQQSLEVLDWAQKHPHLRKNIIHYNIVINMLGQSGKWQQVLPSTREHTVTHTKVHNHSLTHSLTLMNTRAHQHTVPIPRSNTNAYLTRQGVGLHIIQHRGYNGLRLVKAATQ